jgi:diguanylate cyclase (GGDEF)-like protein
MEKSFTEVIFKEPIIEWLKSRRFSDIIGFYSDQEFINNSAIFMVDLDDNKLVRMHVGQFDKLREIAPGKKAGYDQILEAVVEQSVLFTSKETISLFFNRQVLFNRYRQGIRFDEVELECLVKSKVIWIHANYMLFKSENDHLCAYILVMNIEEYHKRKDKTASSFAREINPLTSLPNMFFFRQLAPNVVCQNIYENNCTAFVHLDIDNFKAYNARYGFSKGDQLLRYIAASLQHLFSEDLVAHFGQDHFAIVTREGGIEERLLHLEDYLKSYPNGNMVHIKSGVYLISDGEVDVSLACDRAKIACDSIKKQFDQSVRFFDEELLSVLEKQKYIIDNIDKAIERDELKVYYQPVFSTKTGKLSGFEALSRWNDQKYGFLSPGEYIEVLEKYRLIHKIDIHMIKRICKDIKKLADLSIPYVPVSVNLSRLDFELCDIANVIESEIKKNNIPRHLLHIEITESVLTENADDLQEKIEFFQTKGYEVWMDDFGSGYSSLNVLKDYNFDVLKIDMLFLRDFESNPKSKEIVASIIEMAKKLGIDTLVEGVETKEQYDYLKEIGCNKVQGYYLGKPSPFDKRLISFIAKNVESKNLKDTNNLILEKSVTKKQDSIITPRILATKYQRAFV